MRAWRRGGRGWHGMRGEVGSSWLKRSVVLLLVGFVPVAVARNSVRNGEKGEEDEKKKEKKRDEEEGGRGRGRRGGEGGGGSGGGDGGG
ncbi:hypothetical protein V1477_015504 [Vespula maculifrons]|uniref:Uncharacterized protein n=1 Tax=Vespula maculifrons TaxID=7453 RepID=A0ABD2BFZ1_VESMC